MQNDLLLNKWNWRSKHIIRWSFWWCGLETQSANLVGAEMYWNIALSTVNNGKSYICLFSYCLFAQLYVVTLAFNNIWTFNNIIGVSFSQKGFVTKEIKIVNKIKHDKRK